MCSVLDSGSNGCGQAIWITIFAANFGSCSAVKLNVSFKVSGCLRVFWRTGEAYIFWLLTTCCPNACFLHSGHPLYDATCDPLQLAHLGFLASLFRHPLSEWFSPQMGHFCFDPQLLAECPKLWQLKHCLTKTGV